MTDDIIYGQQESEKSLNVILGQQKCVYGEEWVRICEMMSKCLLRKRWKEFFFDTSSYHDMQYLSKPSACIDIALNTQK